MTRWRGSAKFEFKNSIHHNNESIELVKVIEIQLHFLSLKNV